MPTLLTVTFSKEFTLTVVANSEEELEAALKRHKYDVDDWDDMAHDGWEHQIIDEIKTARAAKRENMLPTKVNPDMGIHQGKCMHITDFEAVQPNACAALEEEIKRVRQEIILDKVNLKLPFPV